MKKGRQPKSQKTKKGNNLESYINKGLTKHEAQNEMMGAGSVRMPKEK